MKGTMDLPEIFSKTQQTPDVMWGSTQVLLSTERDLHPNGIIWLQGASLGISSSLRATIQTLMLLMFTTLCWWPGWSQCMAPVKGASQGHNPGPTWTSISQPASSSSKWRAALAHLQKSLCINVFACQEILQGGSGDFFFFPVVPAAGTSMDRIPLRMGVQGI